LREALKETLAQNVAKNSDDIAETIQQINDGEILDTFNEDNNLPLSHNLHTNHIPKNKLAEDISDTVSLPGDRGDSSKRKFRQVLGDRELMLKQNKLSTQDLSGSNEKLEKDEEMGSGLFDRFSLARKTLDRSSIRYDKNICLIAIWISIHYDNSNWLTNKDHLSYRRKAPKDESDTMSLNDLSFERKKSSMSDWKSKLASKFKSGNKDYEVIGNGAEDGINIESYKRTSDEFGDSIPSAPRTEPIKRKPMQNGSAVGAHKGVKDDPNKQQISLTSNKRPTPAGSTRGNRNTATENGRRVSNR